MADKRIILTDPLTGDRLFPAVIADNIFNADGTLMSLTSIPPGVICIWSGSSDNVPDGWHLCDGTNGTPDLRGRFILGSNDNHVVGHTGGNATVTLSIDNIPSHNHSFSGSTKSSGSHRHSFSGFTDSSGSHTHTLSYSNPISSSISGGNSHQEQVLTSSSSTSGTTSSAGSHGHSISGSIDSNGDHTHTLSGNIGNTGNGRAFDIMPPYYALCYIMKL